MSDISPDKISAISSHQADSLAREISQIVFAKRKRDEENKGKGGKATPRKYKGVVGRARQAADWAAAPLKDRISKPGHRHGIKSNGNDKLAMGAKGGATRNPKAMGTKFHEINMEMGKKNSKGQWVYKGANFTIKSKSSNDITVTRKGEETPALKIKKGRVKANNLTKPEIAKTHKAHSKAMSQGMGR